MGGLPIFATFAPQLLTSIALCIGIIVMFTIMHDQAITRTMETGVTDSMRFAEQKLSTPFTRMVWDTKAIHELIKMHDAFAWRELHPSGWIYNDTSFIREVIEFQTVLVNINYPRYPFVYQTSRHRYPYVRSTYGIETDNQQFGWSGTSTAIDFSTLTIDSDNIYIFNQQSQATYPQVNLTIEGNFAGFDDRLAGYVQFITKLTNSTEDRAGKWGALEFYFDIFNVNTDNLPFVLYTYSIPITWEPATGFATSAVSIDMNCVTWLNEAVSELNIVATDLTLIRPVMLDDGTEKLEVMASSFPALARGFECNDTWVNILALWEADKVNNNPTKFCNLFNPYSSPEPRLRDAMNAIAAAAGDYGVNFNWTNMPTELLRLPKGSDHIYSLRRMRESGLNLLLVGVTDKSHYFDEGDEAQRDSIIISVCLIALMIIVAIATARLLQRPLKRLGYRMDQTASLKDDEMDDLLSIIDEISDMQKAYLKMKSELNRIRPFLPQSIVALREDSGSETTFTNVLDIDQKSSGSASNVGSALPPPVDELHEFAPFSIGSEALREETNVITPRDCLVAIVSVAYGLDLDEADAIPTLDSIFRTIFSAADNYRGTIESVTPFQVVITFGAHSTVSNPAGEALKMALRIAHGTRNAKKYSVSTLLDAQSAFVGCCGTARFRQNIVFSEDIEALKTLSVVTHQLHKQPIVATGRITPSFGNRVHVLPTDLLEFQRGGEKLVLHAISQRNSKGAPDEEAPALREIRQAFAALAQGGINAAEGHLKDANAVLKSGIDGSSALRRFSSQVCDSLGELTDECRRFNIPCRRFASWGFIEAGFTPSLPQDGGVKQISMRAQQQIESLEKLNARNEAHAFQVYSGGNGESGHSEVGPGLFSMALPKDDPYGTGGGDNNNPLSAPSPGGIKQVRNWQLSMNPIAGGSFGRVYRALHGNGSLAAVKVLPLHSRAMTVDALQKELSITAQQRHENLVGYVDAQVSEEEMLVVMELMAGGSLADLMRDFGKLPLRMVRRFTLGVLRGLAHLHRAKIVHCDVKPQNCLLGVDGVCKLADFGSALHPRMGPTVPEDSFGAVGTPAYMAPEVARGEEATTASDVWSVGMMVHELLTGYLPLNEMQHAVMRTRATNVVRMVGRFSDNCKDPDEPEAPPRPNLKTSDMNGASAEDVELVNKFIRSCLCVDPSKRPSVDSLIVMEFLL